MSKTNLKQIELDLKKWLIASQKIKLSSTICYSKIRAQMAIYESKASASEICELQSNIGEYLKLNIQIFTSTIIFYIEDKIQAIQNNCLGNIDAIFEDLERMQSCEEQKITKNRKRIKNTVEQTPVKKRRVKRKLFSEDAESFLSKEAQGIISYYILSLVKFVINFHEIYF